MLPQENADRLKHLKENPGELESTEPADLHPHFLPYKTIGEEGVLLAVVLDDLCIHTPREVIHVANPVLALAVGTPLLWEKSTRFLPYKTIGEEGVLLAVVLDDLCIHTPREVVHVANPVLALAVEPSALGKEYQVLLNSRILH